MQLFPRGWASTALLAPFFFVIVITTAGGCSSRAKSEAGERTPADELRELAGVLTLYSGQNGRGPAKPADLEPYEVGAPLAYRSVLAGDIIVVWGATMPGEGDVKTSGTTAIIAYQKQGPTEGGYVLLHNGTIKQLSATEFAAAPKAGN